MIPDFSRWPYVLDIGAWPIGTPFGAEAVTVPLHADIGDVPPDLQIPPRGEWPKLNPDWQIAYPGGNAALDLTFHVLGLRPDASIAELLSANGFARLSYRIRRVWLEAGTASDFTIDMGDCIGSSGDTCTTGPIAFTPKAAGRRSDIVHLSIGDVTIEGTGSWVSIANLMIPIFLHMIQDFMLFEIAGVGLSIDPSSSFLNCGSRAEGTVGPPSSVTVRNVDSQSITAKTAITGEHPSDLVLLSPPGPVVLATGASIPVEVEFQPTKRGVRAATLQLSCDTDGSPATVSLVGRGTGPIVTIAPGGLKFQDTAVQTVSQPLMLTVTNGGDGPLIVSSLAVARESTPGSFSIVEETCTQAPIPVGESRVVAVAFHPQEIGVAAASLELNDNGDDSPQHASLVGMGTPSANLAVAISCPPTGPTGSQVTYDITVRNEGPGTAVQVILSHDLPANATFVSFAPPGPYPYKVVAPPPGATGTLDVHLGDLPPGTIIELETTVEVAAVVGDDLMTTVYVASGTPDPYQRTNSADVSLRVT